VAETEASADTTQEPVPEQAPPHPVKEEPLSGVGVSDTLVP